MVCLPPPADCCPAAKPEASSAEALRIARELELEVQTEVPSAIQSGAAVESWIEGRAFLPAAPDDRG
jgi:hypothetical protein